MKQKRIINGYEVAGRMPAFIKELRDAAREGRKTVTRRVIKGVEPDWELATILDDGRAVFDEGNGYAVHYVKIPWRVGDVRYLCEPLERRPGINEGDMVAHYQDDGDLVISEGLGVMDWRWKPRVLTARYMPREAARTMFRITGIRAERLQDITMDDIVAEGLDFEVGKVGEWFCEGEYYHIAGAPYTGEEYAFIQLWDSINAARGHEWAKNEWVWRVEFERVEGKQ